MSTRSLYAVQLRMSSVMTIASSCAISIPSRSSFLKMTGFLVFFFVMGADTKLAIQAYYFLADEDLSPENGPPRMTFIIIEIFRVLEGAHS